LEPAHPPDPDAAFDREWAQESVARAMKKLQQESEAKGNGQLFLTLQGALEGQQTPTKETATRLGITAGAVKVALHRLRQRFRQLLRAEIAQTVSDPSEIDEEMRYLVEALRKH
jgi:RNA polymerase sigma-70 factor (ECF subfamily)